MTQLAQREELARRLGLHKLAERLHERRGPWIVPTAAAYNALQAAGMLPPDAPEPETPSLGPYR